MTTILTLIGIGLLIAFGLGLLATTVGTFFITYIPMHCLYLWMLSGINKVAENDLIGSFCLKSIMLIGPIVLLIFLTPTLTPIISISMMVAVVAAFVTSAKSANEK